MADRAQRLACTVTTRRRLLAVPAAVVSGAVAAGLAACGGVPDEPPRPDPAPAPPELSFAAHGDQSWQEFWDTVVARFNGRDGPRVTARFFTSEPDGFKKYFVLIAA